MDMLQQQYLGYARTSFEQMDKLRRQRGRALDAAGFGPLETPYRIVHAARGVRLRKYQDTPRNGPALLIVPAPIKRPYIWDLAPEVSVVRRCLAQGLHVYLAEWEEAPGNELGLDDYGDRLLGICTAAIADDCGKNETILAGHSLGGLLATIHACLHPQRLQALVLLESPLHFGADAGNFAPLVATAPDARRLAQSLGSVPGSFLSLVSVAAAPRAFQWERYLDLSLSLADSHALANHLRVQRWTQDEFPLPGNLFADVVERLYRDDQLMRGALEVGGRRIGPQDLRTPLLSVIDPRSNIIPPQSILPFHAAAASPRKKTLRYEGDYGVGIQHVGALVGRRAHAALWPAIFQWLADTGIVERRAD